MKSSHLSYAVALALGLAACGQKEEPKKAEAPAPAAPAGLTVTIAHAGPLTGSIAHLGKDDENGVSLAISQANDKKITIDDKGILQGGNDMGKPMRIEGATTPGLKRTALIVLALLMGGPDDAKAAPDAPAH